MNRVSLGVIINVRGLKGEVKIQSTSSFSSVRYKKGNKVFLKNYETNTEKEMTVLSFSHVGSFDYVRFEEINNVDEANLYRGYEVEVSTEQLPLLKDQYYYYQLIGLNVVDENNNNVGKVISAEDYPSGCILRIKDDKEYLVPFVKSFILEVNLDKKFIKIKLVEGLR